MYRSVSTRETSPSPSPLFPFSSRMKLRFFISQSENSSRSKYALLGVAVCLSSCGRATSWLKTESRNCFSQIIPRRLFVSAAALFRAQPCLNFRSGPKGPVSSLPRSLARILFPRVPKIISFQLTRHFTQPSLVQRDPPSPRFNFVLFKDFCFVSSLLKNSTSLLDVSTAVYNRAQLPRAWDI